jgi:lactoylglutathione lyase
MKRFHIHLSVDKLAESQHFYSKLFGQEPTVSKPDYAKWLLNEPAINFAISARGHQTGLNHLGFQADSVDDLQQLEQQAHTAAGNSVIQQGETRCCYAKSDKHWVIDPSGIAWEHYRTMEAVETFGEDSQPGMNDVACCIPTAGSNVCS